MHIERLRLRDVGPFDDVTIDFPKGTDPALADVYLLTGPNGTGKSTVLYALAALLAAESKLLGRDLLGERMRSHRGLAALQTDRGEVRAIAPGDAGAHELLDRGPFGGAGMVEIITGGLAHYVSDADKLSYAEQASRLDISMPLDGRSTVGWAAFSYAGLRSVSDVRIIAIHEPKLSPFENSLSFLQTADTNQLANWIASQSFRRLKAKEAGNDERAEQLARSVRDIERVIAEIVDDPSFGFVITDEDDDVRVRWRGRTIRLGLLPDGLESIVSWVGDLLMRLDRIPWHDATPVLQRSFLLLLDEIDIHLHPAWQRKVLPLVQRMFPNAQIIASTHSPFVVSSVDAGSGARGPRARGRADRPRLCRAETCDAQPPFSVAAPRWAIGVSGRASGARCDDRGALQLLRKLEPAPAASPDEQHRARVTIDVLDLNRSGACVSQKHAVSMIRRAHEPDELADLGYRYLIPLCREAR